MRYLALLLALAVFGKGLTSAGARAGQAPREPVTVIFLRHAETIESTLVNRDPELSDRGEARAGDVARLLHASAPTHLFSTPYRRTRDTLAPLAERTDREIRVIDAPDEEEWLRTLRGLPPGSVAVVAGHSNTVPGLIRGLGGSVRDLVDQPPNGEILAHDSYDRMFVLTLPGVAGAAPSTIELRTAAPVPKKE